MTQAIIWTIASFAARDNVATKTDINAINALGGRGYHVTTTLLSDADFSAELAILTAAPVASAIKVGVIASTSHVEILADFLQGYKQKHPELTVIYEPLSISLSDMAKIESAGNVLINVIKIRLLPIVDVLILPQEQGGTDVAMLFAATKQAINSLLNLGVKSVCAKAIAVNNKQQSIVLDVYIDGQREILLSSPNVTLTPSSKDENSGVFSSALATVIAQDYPVDDALVVARAYLNQTSDGWPTDRSDFPQVVLPNTELGDQLGLVLQMQLAYDFAPCDTNRLGLYPVVDTIEWLDKVLQQGVKTLQLRIKDKAPSEVVDDIKAAVALGRQYKARLFINDYWQLAIEHGAYGVHLGQEDMLTADFVAIKKAGLKLGLSTHGYYEILRAHQIKPSYIALGHIYPTVTKDMPSKPQGLKRLQRYADLMQDYPLVAIGGISIARAPQVAATGVGSVAVVTAITRADDYKQAIADLLAIAEPQSSLTCVSP
ncbi:thiamine phosphate synthase [Moritella viscosa]|uniref:Thiamine-phosphate synthase n=1 Tax=Moritella viscosa TaxID=80854 RepID=A0ABY1HES3_9GAMM|nr:thiamine phosphate synthase [Moritella viscosa]CED58257.1 thiamine-phosphate pyrophosphorylase ThiE [Moritella viscosa]SGY94660.1 Thiamine-phosphate pyrophosphorylase [Moritella viscosa]SGZ06404.1 Thiamine-phosphate pyrophosphorylase [Moritella viscosa]SHO10231.1 Thiamine-phosphate pyrophosphorylase [Moritella viscosa]SHO22576.1 Thiamine-phosphate pyrophosphorylase [Moritella viscosa]